MTRREALTTIGKAAVGAGVVAAVAAAGPAMYLIASRSAAPSAASGPPQSSSTTVEPGFISLFDGETLDGWEQAGPGGFTVVDGNLQSNGGMGLLWYTKQEFADFVLKCDWKEAHFTDNSGVFMRFPNPLGDPWNAVNEGYEIQIDNVGAPNGNPIYQTGAVFNFAAPSEVASNPVGEWNYYEIRAVGQQYTVILNGVDVTNFTGSRSTVGYVGLQNHDDTSTISFRNIRIMEL